MKSLKNSKYIFKNCIKLNLKNLFKYKFNAIFPHAQCNADSYKHLIKFQTKPNYLIYFKIIKIIYIKI
jgi:hypothetical protein